MVHLAIQLKRIEAYVLPCPTTRHTNAKNTATVLAMNQTHRPLHRDMTYIQQSKVITSCILPWRTSKRTTCNKSNILEQGGTKFGHLALTAQSQCHRALRLP